MKSGAIVAYFQHELTIGLHERNQNVVRLAVSQSVGHRFLGNAKQVRGRRVICPPN